MSYSVKASAVYWYEGLNGTKERELQPASVRKRKRKRKQWTHVIIACTVKTWKSDLVCQAIIMLLGGLIL